ncbi:Rhodanese-like domain-containing protein [Lactifluus subvellereus]|nr:Rhodanese-like domain-containing protein [Lactifluus subvellereus]
MPVKYISGDDLSAIIKSDKRPRKDYLIVDVRDDDYIGGNITNCHNVPSVTFLDNLDDLVRDAKEIPQVIFHCALSQSRGPKAARIYNDRRKQLQDDKDIPQQVLILRGGFTEFQAKFKDDPQLVENWNKHIWAAEWSF